MQLQEELAATENKVAFARQYYNDTVRSLNSAIVTFPSMLFVGMSGVSKREFYEVPEGTSRSTNFLSPITIVWPALWPPW